MQFASFLTAQKHRVRHGLNMVHRDVKPDNILVTKKGVVKLADLGMVKTHDEDMSLTQTGHAVGTPWYMPLEQARNAKEIDGRSDIYALGCTLYAFLTGSPPFVGRTIVDVIKAKELGTFPPARQVNSDVPERLDLILAKMTAKLPNYRYQSCDEVTKDLESLGLASETLSFLNEKPVDVEISPKSSRPPSVRRASRLRNRGRTWTSPNPRRLRSTPTSGSCRPSCPTAPRQRASTPPRGFQCYEEGTMMPTARASHLPTEGFRTLGTYKEFQGVALGTLAKKAADKNTWPLSRSLQEENRRRRRNSSEKKQKWNAVANLMKRRCKPRGAVLDEHSDQSVARHRGNLLLVYSDFVSQILIHEHAVQAIYLFAHTACSAACCLLGRRFLQHLTPILCGRIFWRTARQFT